jgi:hypothetical protein
MRKVAAYIVNLIVGAYGKEQVSIKTIVFKPLMLHDEALYLGAPIGFGGLHAFIPTGCQAGVITPYHMYFRIRTILIGVWVGIFDELVFYRSHVLAGTPESDRGIEKGFFEKGLGEELLLANARSMAMTLIYPIVKSYIAPHVYPCIAITCRDGATRHSQVSDNALVDSRFPQSVHSQQDCFHPGGFMGKRTSDVTSTKIMYDRGSLGGKFSR